MNNCTKQKKVNSWIYVLFKVICLLQIVLLVVILERGMFCKQLLCNNMIYGITFQATIHECKVKGANIFIFCTYKVSFLCNILMLKIDILLQNKNYVTCLNAYLFIFSVLNKMFFSLCKCGSIVKKYVSMCKKICICNTWHSLHNLIKYLYLLHYLTYLT